MSSYLSNLTARTAEMAPLLQPRLPSVYEPAVSGPQRSLYVEDQQPNEVEDAVQAPLLVQWRENPPASKPAQPEHRQSEAAHHSPAAAEPVRPASIPEPPNSLAESKSPEKRVDTPRTLQSQQKEFTRNPTKTVFLERIIEKEVKDPPTAESWNTSGDAEIAQFQPPPQSAETSALNISESAAQPIDVPQMRTQVIHLPTETQAIPFLTPLVEQRPDDLVAEAGRQVEQALERPLPWMPGIPGEVKHRKEQGVGPPLVEKTLQDPATGLERSLPAFPAKQLAPPELSQLRLEQRAHPAVPDPSPTVEVHIGRIEVRAMRPPAKPQARQKRKATGMSLDDYLKQRNDQGKRG